MARTTHNPAITAIVTAADIRDSITWSWDDDDIAVMDDDCEFECDNPF